MEMRTFVLIYLCLLICFKCHASHFRGGTISWKPVRNNTVEFKFKMGWTYGSGPGCTDARIGQFVNDSFIGDKVWKCTTGCSMANKPVGTIFYFCSASNTIGSADEKWEQGENTFQETFTGTGPYNVGYSGAMWMSLDFGQPNGWNVETTVDLRTRDDINSPNSSPITASKPLYTLQFSCYHELKLPMHDPDGDLVKCRWAVGRECDSVCHAVPAAYLDEDTCTLKFNASAGLGWVEDGWYAVALTFEDFPTKAIHVGNELYNETTPMSTVPLQFLIHLLGKQTPCTFKPEFVSPTPAQGSTISIPAKKTFNQKIYAANLQNKNESITKLTLTGPAGMKFTGPLMDASRPDVYYWNLTWTPTLNDKGDNIVCCQAWDSSGHSSINRCFTVIAWDSQVDPCKSNPCRGQQHCVRIGSSQNIKCVCPVGYTMVGQACQVTTTPTTTTAKTTKWSTTTAPTTSTTIKTTTRPTTTTPTTSTTKRTTTATQTTTTTQTTASSLTTIIPTKYMATPKSQTTNAGTIPAGGKASSMITINGAGTGSSTAIRTTGLPGKQSNSVTYNVASSAQGTGTGGNVNKITGSPGNGLSMSSKELPSSNCFSSKPVVLFTTFFVITIVALAAVAGVLTYMLRKMRKQLKEIDSSKDSFEIDTKS